jgi:hypothetical protein
VVPGAVNAEEVAIMGNHIEMTKFSGPEDDGFKKVSGHLSLMMANAISKADENWQIELQDRTTRGT